jgi:adenine deaminase
LSTVKVPRPLVAQDFSIEPAPDGTRTARVIVASGSTVISQEEHVALPEAGSDMAVERDVLKVAAIERVRGTGQIGLGFVRGFGLQRGALATTFNSQQQNVIVVGADDTDMAAAVNALVDCGGGFVVIADGEVKALLELPLFGLQSTARYDDVVAGLHAVNRAAAELGCPMPEPFPTLGFVGLPVEIGALRIAPEGVVDVAAARVVSPWVV